MADALDQKGLKPCPFCGKQPTVSDYRVHEDETGEREGYAAVECHCLGSNGGLFFHFDTTDEAIAAWNRRSTVTPAEIAEVVAELREHAGSCVGSWEDWANRSDTLMREAATLIERLAASQAETRRLALEEAAEVAEGWSVEAADNDYQTCGNGNFWDVGTLYDQGRHDAAFHIRALIDQPSTEGGRDG